MQSILLCNVCTLIKAKNSNKRKFHTSCHIVTSDSEAHHLEIEVQTQIVSNRMHTLTLQYCTATRKKENAMFCHIKT